MKPLITVLGICALVLTPGIASADLHTWDGDIGSDWSEGDNWTSDVAPATSDDITITDNSTTSTCIYDSSAAASPYGTLTIGGSMTLTVSRSGGLEFEGLTTVSGSWDLTGAEPLYLRYVSVTADATIDNQSSAGLYADRVTVDASSSQLRLTLDNDANQGFYCLREVVLKGSGANAAQLTVTSADVGDVYIGTLDVTGSTEDEDAGEEELLISADLTVTGRTIFRGGASINCEIDVAANMTFDMGQVVFNQGTYNKNGTGVAFSS